MSFGFQAPVAVPSAASFPDGAAPPATKTTAMDDLLGLESEISAIQVSTHPQKQRTLTFWYAGGDTAD